MIINCGFERQSSLHPKRFEHRNVTGIKVDLPEDTDGKLIRQELMKHKPDGAGWYITGYAFVK